VKIKTNKTAVTEGEEGEVVKEAAYNLNEVI